MAVVYFIDLRYEWSILSVLEFSNFAKPASDWLETKPRAVSCGRIYVTNFKTSSSTKALQKLCIKLYIKLYKSSTKALSKALQHPTYLVY